MPDNVQGAFTERAVDTQFPHEGAAGLPLDPIAIEIPDDELVDIMDDHVLQYKNFYSAKYDLFERRKKLETHFFGRQVLEKEKERLLKDYESKFMDNVLWEIASTIKPLAMSRLPDLIVTPGNDSEESVLTAQEISKAVDTDIKRDDNRRVLGLAGKHLPVYLTGVVKVRWNPEIDDYVFECIHPTFIEVDFTCPDNIADHMSWINQIIPTTPKQLILRFPKKEKEIIEELHRQGIVADPNQNPTYKALATPIRYRECWFTEYRRKSDTKTERIEGVLWKFGQVILDKMKNPNFDYEGEERYFSYDDNNQANKRPLNEGELASVMLTGQLPDSVQEEKVYHNYFRFPRKPFYFFGYDQWGKQPYDETSWMEQNLQNQRSLDKRGKQLEETLDQRGHHIFSKESGLTPSDVEEMDLNAPDEDIVVDGDVAKVHKFIEPERPGAEEFKEMANIRERMYASSGSNAVRGEVQTPTATNNQIAREANFTRADDLVAETVNPAAQWMAEWALQMIKLRYTEDHFRDILGVAGQAVYIKLNRNMISDGMIVKIKASGTDKIQAQNNAMDMAKMQMTDPYTFFCDMNLSDPEGRTEKLILSKADPIAYLQKVVKGLNTSEALAKALMNQQLPSPAAPMQQQPQPNPPTMSGAEPQSQGGMIPQGMPQQPTPGNTSAIAATPPPGAPAGSPRAL